jgi:hypothetical protein
MQRDAGTVQALSPARSFRILDVELRLATDDEALLDEFASIFGGDEPAAGAPRASFSATVEAGPSTEQRGRLKVVGDGLADPAAFLLGFSSPTIPMRALESPDSAEVRVGLGDDPDPIFVFRADDCLFRKVSRWRRIVSHFLFLRLLRMRADLLFFHAASVGIAGKGLLLVGPKGAGKSTLSSGLAARGHDFLGDETAAFEPASRRLLPFRRPLGIKPGPRASAIGRALESAADSRDEDGMLRVRIESLVPGPAPTPVPLRAVVFLAGFASKPALTKVEAGREELAQMQPLASSLAGGTATRSVFEMIRLLGSVACHRLVAGDPDETITLLEEAFTRP